MIAARRNGIVDWLRLEHLVLWPAAERDEIAATNTFLDFVVRNRTIHLEHRAVATEMSLPFIFPLPKLGT